MSEPEKLSADVVLVALLWKSLYELYVDLIFHLYCSALNAGLVCRSPCSFRALICI